MQAAAAAAAAAATVFCTGPFPLGQSTKKSLTATLIRRIPMPHTALVVRIRAAASSTPEISTVDYSSPSSVFPAEACDTIGGEACDAKMFPEMKPPTTTSSSTKVKSEEVDRDYLEYNEPKTVFPGEACDDLGGEFCEPEYQEGVYREKKT